MDVAVISCGSKKQRDTGKLKAKDLYTGLWFKWSRRFAESNYPNWCILSAKYHVVFPDDELEYYNLYLGNLKKEEKEEWNREVLKELLTKFPAGTHFDFYTGVEYYQGLTFLMDENHIDYTIHLEGLGLGYKLQWFKEHTKVKSKKLF